MKGFTKVLTNFIYKILSASILVVAITPTIIGGVLLLYTVSYAIRTLDITRYKLVLETISALGSAGAVMVALYTFRKDANARYNTEKRNQASKIYTYVDGCYGDSEGIPIAKVKVVNNSDLPIYNVFVLTVSNKPMKDIVSEISTKQGHKYSSIIIAREYFFKIEAGGSGAGGEKDSSVIFFSDANSHGWYRGKNGKLLSVDDYEEKYINDRLEILPPLYRGVALR